MPATKKQKANLKRGKTKNLKKGGKRARPLTFEEINFCSFMAQVGVIAQAAKYADVKKRTASDWMKKELVLKTITEFQEKYKAHVGDRDAERLEERKALTHREWKHNVTHVKTHFYRGDEAVCKLLEMAMKANGDIQPAKSVVQANAIAGAQVTNQIYAKRLYLPDWRREAIEKVQAAELSKLNDDRRPGPPEVPAAN